MLQNVEEDLNFRCQSAHTPFMLKALQNGLIAIIKSKYFFKDIGLKVTL